MKPDYVDVLILTALEEERFIFDREFPREFCAKFEPLGYSVTPSTARLLIKHGGHSSAEQKNVSLITVRKSNGFCVAWTSLKGPGNVWAYDEASQLIELTSPRFVMLVGVSGGSANSFVRGDVGYASCIGFSSYSKIESETLQQFLGGNGGLRSDTESQHRADALASLKACGIDPSAVILTRIEIRSTETVEPTATFCSAAGNLSDEWKGNAKKWYEACKADFEGTTFDVFGERKSYPPQDSFENGTPNLCEGVVASGDFVVASSHLRDAMSSRIKVEIQRTKKLVPANMFEMESYGIGLCCKRRDTPFGMVKGISDLASQEKTDRHRLAAIASASAVAFELVCEHSFMQGLQERGKRHAWSQHACVWSESSRPDRCSRPFEPCDEPSLFFQERPCNGLGDSGLRELPGTRLFEGVTSPKYSAYIQKVAEKSDSQLKLMFPYSVEDLYSFFYAMDDPQARQAVDNMRKIATKEGLSDSDRRSRLVRVATLLGKRAYRLHGHFSTTNAICAEMIKDGRSYGEIARKACRVMCLYEKDLVNLETDPRFLLHVYMCGLCVPTLLAHPRTVSTYGSDEATYITVDFDIGIQDALRVTKCLKFSDRAELLAVVGACDDAQRSTRENKIHDLALYVNKAIGVINDAADVQIAPGAFSIFPSLVLLDNCGLNWRDDDTLVPGYADSKGDRSCFENYFASLLNATRSSLGAGEGG